MSNSTIKDLKLYDFRNKELALTNLVREYFNKCLSMFDYDNLPETLNKRYIEGNLLRLGHTAFVDVNDNLYSLYGGLCGVEKSPNYDYTQITIANPALNISKLYTDDVDCVLCRNLPDWTPIMEILKRYCSIIVEGNLSLNMWASFGSRVNAIISAQDERTKIAGQNVIDGILRGDYSIIGETTFLEGIKVSPLGANNSSVINILELLQYTQAELYKTLGISSNNNRKREALSSNETEADFGCVLPLVDLMLQEREEAIDRVNRLFGTNIKVKKSSVWEDIQEQADVIEISSDDIISDEDNINSNEDNINSIEEIEEDKEEINKEEINKEENEEEQEENEEATIDINININTDGEDTEESEEGEEDEQDNT